MNALDIIINRYNNKITDIARELVNDHIDKLETTYENGHELYEASKILDLVADRVNSMYEDQHIDLIRISPMYAKKTTNKFGLLIEDADLDLLWGTDHDDITYVIDKSKENFIEQHNDVYEQVIQDVKSEVSTLAKKEWLKMDAEEL